MKKKQDPVNSNIAGKTYETSDYGKNNQLSSGLATSHEQVSDTFVEGTIDTKIVGGNKQTD